MGRPACRGRDLLCRESRQVLELRNATPGCWRTGALPQCREQDPKQVSLSGLLHSKEDYPFQSDVILFQPGHGTAVSLAHYRSLVNCVSRTNPSYLISIIWNNLTCEDIFFGCLKGRNCTGRTWLPPRSWQWCRAARCRGPTPHSPSGLSAPSPPA